MSASCSLRRPRTVAWLSKQLCGRPSSIAEARRTEKSRGVPTRQTAEEFVSFRVRTNTVLLTAGT